MFLISFMDSLLLRSKSPFFYSTRRIFPTSQFYLWTNIVGFFVIAWLLGQNLGAGFQCSPVQKAWELEIPRHCLDILKFDICFQAANIVLDIVILALPMSAIYQLQMSRVKKISVAAVFLLGDCMLDQI